MIGVHELVSGYRDTTIINGLSLEIPDGQFVAVLGRNGVGKTTLLKSLFGLCEVTSGTLSLDGNPVRAIKPEFMARQGYSFLPDDRGVFAELTVRENLRLSRRREYTPAVDVHRLFPLLEGRADQQAGSLSGGQKQQLGIARAILQGYRLIAVDELSQGLQPNVAHATMGALRQLTELGISVVIVEQSPTLPLEYCDRIVGMVKGQITFDEGIEAARADSKRLTNLLVVT